MEVNKCIKERRSIKSYKDKKVEWKKITDILDAARYAPSSGNMQNWRFIVVEDKERKEKLAKAALKQVFIEEASHVIVVCSDAKEIKRFYRKRSDLYSVQNTALAAQNIMLKAHSLGVGSCWIGAFDEDAVKSACKITGDINVHCLIALGYPGQKVGLPRRMDMKDLVYFEEWNNKKK